MTVRLVIDKRPFSERVVRGLGYKELEAFKLLSVDKQCVDDFGGLMPIQTFNILSNVNGTFMSRCNDVDYLQAWSDHYKACNCPFLVVRENNIQIAIYKQRVICEMPNIMWNKLRERELS